MSSKAANCVDTVASPVPVTVGSVPPLWDSSMDKAHCATELPATTDQLVLEIGLADGDAR